MGQCVSTSKDQHLKITEIDERCYIAISDEFEYFDYHDEVSFSGFSKLYKHKINFRKMSRERKRKYID